MNIYDFLLDPNSLEYQKNLGEEYMREKEFYDKIGKVMGWDFSTMKYDVVDNSEFRYFEEINQIQVQVEEKN